MVVYSRNIKLKIIYYLRYSYRFPDGRVLYRYPIYDCLPRNIEVDLAESLFNLFMSQRDFHKQRVIKNKTLSENEKNIRLEKLEVNEYRIGMAYEFYLKSRFPSIDDPVKAFFESLFLHSQIEDLEIYHQQNPEYFIRRIWQPFEELESGYETMQKHPMDMIGQYMDDEEEPVPGKIFENPDFEDEFEENP